ncbi:hypothetical protein DFH29DRAFT_1000933 [Suillus ampliporus]|nr:hypothetical protein DFH29DRAFT_1000933 [Suillus ampliporus]
MSVPDDKDELLEEKEDWMCIWVDLTTRLGACVMVGKDKGIILALSTDEVTTGEVAQVMYIHFHKQSDTTSVATGMVTRKKLVMEVSVLDVPGVSKATRSKAVPPCMSAKTSIDPNFVLHDLPCTQCQAKDTVFMQLCNGFLCHREKPDTGRASAVSASVAGSIHRTVSSPTLDSGAKDASSDGESEAPADPMPCHIRPCPTHWTNKGKEHAINVNESADEKLKLRMENDELHHGLHLAQGKLLKMYEMTYDLADELRKMEAKLADHK